uniref:Thyroglobulin type-1 domain-containing protein n=1 Tax=Steinernema glaseri TaxID=37863 RepID=A0A1I7YY85_9BILA
MLPIPQCVPKASSPPVFEPNPSHHPPLFERSESRHETDSALELAPQRGLAVGARERPDQHVFGSTSPENEPAASATADDAPPPVGARRGYRSPHSHLHHPLGLDYRPPSKPLPRNVSATEDAPDVGLWTTVECAQSAESKQSHGTRSIHELQVLSSLDGRSETRSCGLFPSQPKCIFRNDCRIGSTPEDKAFCECCAFRRDRMSEAGRYEYFVTECDASGDVYGRSRPRYVR